MILVLFTDSYPFDSAAEQTFLDVEIKHLTAVFDKVTIVPRKCAGTKLPLPNNAEVADGYSKFLETSSKVGATPRVIFSPLFYRDLINHPWLLLNLKSLRRLFAFLGGAYLAKQWVENWIEENQIDARQCVFYAYWFNQESMGIGLAKQTNPKIKLATRAHGYDLYEERYAPPYWPGRPSSLEVVDLLLPDSEAGLTYFKKRYPMFSSRCEAALLGVLDSGFITAPSSDDVFRLASCSIIRPVKRVDLLLEGVAAAARCRPRQKIEWRHFGNSEVEGVRENLQKYADDSLPANAQAFFLGYTTQQDLFEFYRANPIDAFFNVSKSEGTPVSSMEALSCGIPIVATAVGGNQEIVTKESGLLLSANPSPDEIADAIFYLIDNPNESLSKRKASHNLWREKYNAEQNYQNFAERLKSMRETGNLL